MIETDPVLVLSWSGEYYASDLVEPDDLIYEISGEILDVDEYDEQTHIGRFRLYYVDVERAYNEGVSVFSIMDSYAHTVDYFDAIFGDSSPDFSEALQELLDHDLVGSNLLILDRVEIFPAYRGKRLGLQALKHMVKRFSPGAAVVAMNPYPLQFESEPRGELDTMQWSELGLYELPTDKAAATKKLRRHYSQLEFVPLPSSPFLVRSTAWPFKSDIP